MSFMPLFTRRCDCCGLVIDRNFGDYCPRCGYPIEINKEERFLEESIRNLQRVATYGGAQATVTTLIQRYQARHNALRQQQFAGLAQQNAPIPAQPEPTIIPPIMPTNTPVAEAPVRKQNENVAQAQAPLASTNAPRQSSTPPPAQNMFSFRSFFADQTINIVSSLGAFLILIGSLSFVVTTTNLFLSFLVVFAVHALFAITGILFSRFPSFRFISRAYITIFALLVPLVGFSGYRLVAGHFIAVSAPTVVAIAALYATLVYAFLAVSQQFKLFGYLSATALVVADFAIAYSFSLNYWWWPILLMPFAFIALLVMRPNLQSSLLNSNLAVLREPIRVLMYSCIAALGMGILYAYFYVYVGTYDTFVKLTFEGRFIGAISLFLLLLWTGAYIWTTKRFTLLAFLPYQFVAVVTAFAYVYNFQAVEYGLLFTAIAVFYHVGTLVARQTLSRFAQLRIHIETILLILVGLVPLLVAPYAPLRILSNATTQFSLQNAVDTNASLALLALVISCAVTLSVVLAHTGFQRMPVASQASWHWLLLLSGLLFVWAYSVALIILRVSPMYAFLGLTLLLLAATVALRRFVSTAWSNPLDVIVLCVAVFTLLLSALGQSRDTNVALVLLFAALSYAMMFYQRRVNLLFLSFLFALFAFVWLWQYPRLEIALEMSLPIVAIFFARTRQPFSFLMREGAKAVRVAFFGWEWPLSLFALLCGIAVTMQDAFSPMSTIQHWVGISFPVALELVSLALVWYVVAVLAHRKWWLIVAGGFAVASLLMPSDSFNVLLYTPFVLALLAVAISQFTSRTWAIPFYIVTLVAAIKMGVLGYSDGHASTAILALLGFAILTYIIGAVEDATVFLWLAPCFALWSVFNSALLGDLYRPPLVALVCAALGVGVSSLAYVPLFSTVKKNTLLLYKLPFYATALAAALLTGIYGMFLGINKPFVAAVPDALLLYALVAYAILVFERQSLGLWLVAAFAAWGTSLALSLNTLGTNLPASFTAYYLTCIALVTGVLGILAGRFVKLKNTATPPFTWSWPWYAVSLLTIVITVLWNYSMSDALPDFLVYSSIVAFIVLTLGITLVERRPMLLVIPIALGIWLIVQTHWQLWQQMLAFGVLFFLLFAVSSVWRRVSGNKHTMLYTALGFVGQLLVLLGIIAQDGLSSDAGALGHVGVIVLLLLAIQLFWYGWTQPIKQHWTAYGAGLLVALAIPWELSILHQTRIEWLTLAPASYLIVIAPFLSRDERIPDNARIGQICSILGSMLLLLPTLWSSFSDVNIEPTFILAGEALALLLIGIGTRVRFFVLTGAALVVISAMHALFLPSLGLPPSLALTIMGVTLLALATGLSLARHRVQAVWTRLE